MPYLRFVGKNIIILGLKANGFALKFVFLLNSKMKKYLFLLFTTAFGSIQAQYQGFSIGCGYVVAPTNMSPAVFNYTKTMDNITVTPTLESEKFTCGAVPIEMELFSKHVNFNFNFYIPVGDKASKESEFKKIYDVPLIKTGIAFGAWAGPVGFFAGLHYHGTNFNVKNFQSTRFTQVTPMTKPLTNNANGDYYISKMGINERGFDAHLMFGKQVMFKASFYYDFVRVGRKSMELDDKVLKGSAITPEISFYAPFDKEKNFGLYLKVSYKSRLIKGSNDFTPDNSGEYAGYFPKVNTKQTMITLGLLLPPGIFGNASSSNTTIYVVPAK